MRRLLTIALCASATAASAQVRPTVLVLPAGARALAVGDAFVAGRSPEVIFYNPAQLSLNPGTSVSVQRYDERRVSGSMATASALPIGAIAIGVQFLNFGEGPLGVRSPSPFGAPMVTNASSFAASLAYNLPAIKTIRSGITAKFAEERVGNTRDGVTAFDVGIARDFFGRTTLAIAAQNLGPAMQIDGIEAKLPRRGVIGGSVFTPSFWTYFDAQAFASVGYSRGEVLPAGGVELTYVPLDGWAFAIRAGAREPAPRERASSLTLGAGLSFDRVSLDWAYHGSTTGGPGPSNRVGLRVR